MLDFISSIDNASRETAIFFSDFEECPKTKRSPNDLHIFFFIFFFFFFFFFFSVICHVTIVFCHVGFLFQATQMAPGQSQMTGQGHIYTWIWALSVLHIEQGKYRIIRVKFHLYFEQDYLFGEAVLTSTHNLCFEQKYEKYQNFYLKIFIFWWENFQYIWIDMFS